MLTSRNISRLVDELAQRVSTLELVNDLRISDAELAQWRRAEKPQYSDEEIWKVKLAAFKHGFFDLLPAHGIPVVSYDISSPFNLLDAPVGFAEDPPIVPLRQRRTQIAGHWVDFPLGLPASVLAANSKWIEFYARRGFDILTYKTVRTRYFKEHPWPNWVFLKNPRSLEYPVDSAVVGCPGYWPEDRTTISMANSFGVPSLAPEWWKEDLRRAREVVKKGHQVLMVSVMASQHGSKEAIAEDFVEAARIARDAGADIIEANYSCPNVQGDPIGDLYRDAEKSGYVSQALRGALGEKTPLFVKIGYLPGPELRKFVEGNAPFIRGIVAINTISAEVASSDGEQIFPDRSQNGGKIVRKTAGISGWAIKAKAQEVVRNLIEFRRSLGREAGQSALTILGVGGVVTEQDVDQYLQLGVDGVESCTGAFLNPHLGLDVRMDRKAMEQKPSRLAFELKVLGKFIEQLAFHSTRPGRLRVDRENRRVVVDPTAYLPYR